MRRHELVTGKKRAQAMVEFALALPILLLLLYGILEAGRLLFIYSSIVTASRQAVRYGSATGLGPNGLPRYQECDAIRAAAQKADYLNAFDDSDIVITYDKIDPAQNLGQCDGVTDTGLTEGMISDNKGRIIVTIRGDFLPIVPKLVPFIERSQTNGNPIEAVSARTILVSVSIYVTAPPSTWIPSTPTHTLTATNTAAPSPTSTVTVTSAPPTATSTVTMTNTPGGPTATATATGTATLPPTATATGTITVIPPTATATGTAVSQCMQLTSTRVFSKSGNTMTVTITNPNNYPVTISNVFVRWNGDRGHTTTGQGDDTLDLQSVSLGSTVIWTGLIDGASSVTINPTSIATIPASAVNLTLNFNFHQSYDRWDTPPSEQVTITFNNPTGCPLNVLDIVRQ